MGVTQKELRERELALVEDHRVIHGTVSTEVAYGLIVADRLERWAKYVAEVIVPDALLPDALKKWAGMMAAIYGPEVLVHAEREGSGLSGYKLDWITALLVVMYGEAEYFWPETLGDDDVKRAHAWLNGKKVPGIITYIPKEG